MSTTWDASPVSRPSSCPLRCSSSSSSFAASLLVRRARDGDDKHAYTTLALVRSPTVAVPPVPFSQSTLIVTISSRTRFVAFDLSPRSNKQKRSTSPPNPVLPVYFLGEVGDMQSNQAGPNQGGRPNLRIAHRRTPSELTPLMSKFPCRDAESSLGCCVISVLLVIQG